MRVEFRDRHADYFDGVELCEHGDHGLGVGDKLIVDVVMNAPAFTYATKMIEAKCEVEIEMLAKNRIRVVVNMPDFIAVRKVLAEESG